MCNKHAFIFIDSSSPALAGRPAGVAIKRTAADPKSVVTKIAKTQWTQLLVTGKIFLSIPKYWQINYDAKVKCESADQDKNMKTLCLFIKPYTYIYDDQHILLQFKMHGT